MIRNEIILIDTAAPLRNYMKRRPTHYAEILSSSNRVINISWADMKYRPQFKNNPFCWEEQIFFRVPGNRFEPVQKVNKILFRNFLRKIVGRLKKKPIFWHFTSGHYDIFHLLPRKLSILEICDDTPEFFTNNFRKYQEVKKYEDLMTQSVDVVFTVSDYLRQKKLAMRPDITVVRNGVNYDDFAVVPELSHDPNDELFSFKPPLVGYTGAISHWLDLKLVERVAKRLKEVNFVFVGRIDQAQKPLTDRLSRMENIHFLGERPYRQLPHYLKYFELCHIPFLLNELVQSVNPIKLYEYLAAGKRVIATPSSEILYHCRIGIVEAAEDIENYCQTIKHMLAEEAIKYVRACQEMARENLWMKRVETASWIIEQKLKDVVS
jgi:hypothetical protein